MEKEFSYQDKFQSLRTMELSELELRNQLKAVENERNEARNREKQLEKTVISLRSQIEEWKTREKKWEREKAALYKTMEGV